MSDAASVLTLPLYQARADTNATIYLPNSVPTYSRQNTTTRTQTPRSEHLFELRNGSKAWALLKVSSSAPSPKSLPVFFQGENIDCALVLRAGSRGESSIQTIKATVSGQIITGSRSEDIHNFLEIVHPIWSKTLSSASSSSHDNTGSPKLVGDCHWQFSIPIPSVVSREGEKVYHLPETFSDRHSDVTIRYTLAIHIVRGKLRPDSVIKTSFAYVPETRPTPASELRQLSYREGIPLLGPDADPQGWKTLQTALVTGRFFENRPVEIQCALSLAKPLSYTRGSVIPFYLDLFSIHNQALKLVSDPNSVVVCLRRCVRYFRASGAHKTKVAWEESFEDVSRASLWVPSSSRNSLHGDDGTTRHLEGEIAIPKNLKPSSSMDHFSISYTVILRCFDVTGFKHTPIHISTTTDTSSSSASTSIPLISEPIEIATMYADGPKPLTYAPPSYQNANPTTRRDDAMKITLSAGGLDPMF